MKEIYVVMACTNYEGNDPIRAYENRPDAEAFVKKCEEYDKSSPQVPDGVENTAEHSKIPNEWDKQFGTWMEHHPAGKDNALYDSLVITTLNLFQNGEGVG